MSTFTDAYFVSDIQFSSHKYSPPASYQPPDTSVPAGLTSPTAEFARQATLLLAGNIPDL